MSEVIAGIRVPDSAIARAATQLVRDTGDDLLYNHSRRVFLWGALTGERRGLKYDPELLYLGAMFHDMGLTETYSSADLRFEVDGANAAREFMKSYGVPERDIEDVWTAIALHTTPGIPQYMRPEIALTNAGVLVDVVGIGYDEYTPEQRDAVIAAFPRGDFKKDFIQAQTRSALKKPQTTFGTVNVDYIEDCDHTFRKPNACTRIRNTPWHS